MWRPPCQIDAWSVGLYCKRMNPALRPLLSAILLALLIFQPLVAFSGMTPKEVGEFNYNKVLAERGDRVGQYNLGICYFNGFGVAVDQVEAVSWWRKSSEQGYAKAQFNLGNCYGAGNGIPRDYVKAHFWCQKAIDQGVVEALSWMGLRYHNGEGVKEDIIEAYAYWKIAGTSDEGARDYLAGLEKKMSWDDRYLGQLRAKKLQGEIEARRVGK